MTATLLSSVADAVSLVFQAMLILGLVALLASASVRSRSALQFEPWKEFNGKGRDDGSIEGERVAELLLTEIRDIQSVHQRSKRGLDLDNPYYDVPAFQQDLDDDLTLLASVQTHSRGQLAGEVVSVLLALMPVRPGRLGGSIHRIRGRVRGTGWPKSRVDRRSRAGSSGNTHQPGLSRDRCALGYGDAERRSSASDAPTQILG